MKQIILITLLLCSITAVAQEQETHILNTDTSVINWRGTYSFLFSEHTGTVKFKAGNLVTNNGNITGGSFVIDMRSITNPEHDEKGWGPVKHLKDPDFFDVEQFPEAVLVINSVEYFTNEDTHKMHGNLTIKGITQPIEFWATANGNLKQLNTKFKIDRTRWGITYNNKLKNEAIADAVEFNVTLQF